MRIKQRFHKLISFSLTASKTAKIPMFVPFNADEMIVRAVDIRSTLGTYDKIMYVYMDKLGTVLDLCTDSTSRNSNTTFKIDKIINGDCTFEIRELDGNLSSIPDGDFAMLLEFIAYE